MDPRLNTGDWAQVFGEPVPCSWDDAGDPCAPQSAMRVEVCFGSPASAAPFTREDVAEVIYFHSDPPDHKEGYLGDWDGCVVVRLNDGRYAACSGWCDYTGWGCQDGTACAVAHELDTLIRFGLTSEQREKFGLTNKETPK